ncbi:CMGC/CLK protein kinase Lkh1 [Schizosaccharomyces japonicus yFS275]|uniref:CMGC/CLK protein kinase Lkh1 n=1 Tax=Schizosaccharomyces japonicus (strain yFS275 / FY16936) TaxID=402676 RepID=B6JX68_SCHJY|nr:CMGC/CLK protein kinase Lkh1 [Schizosaccharomyces japonicus yFS275]EEB05969.1 CMGC/CLK protein kinase Lkh1 [Schizosaccharomyces japonicus yFS275]
MASTVTATSSAFAGNNSPYMDFNDCGRKRRRRQRPNWQEFYKNGFPQEVIVIEDSASPRASPFDSTKHAASVWNGYNGGYENWTDVANGPALANGGANTQEAAATTQPFMQQTYASSLAAAAPARNSIPTAAGYRSTGMPYNGAAAATPSSTLALSTGNNLSATNAPVSSSYSTLANGMPLSPTLAVWMPMTQSMYQPPMPNATYHPEALCPRLRPRSSNSIGAALTNTAAVQPAKRKRASPPTKVERVQVPIVPDTSGLGPADFDEEDGHYKVVANTNFTSRYTILRLLGQGTFGKVVQCFDQVTKKFCAIKIIRSIPKYREASLIELRVLKTISQNDPDNENKCIQLRDYFEFRKHVCIVTDLYSWSVFDFLKSNNYIPFPAKHIQSFARQLFKSVAFLHELNLVHTDLKPENILLVSNACHAVRSPTLGFVQKILDNCDICLIDFGSATFNDEYHSSVVSTRHYRAPEIILGMGWSFPCDIWSIGCLIVELFTGQALFQTHENSEHLAMMERIIGKFDRSFVNRAARPARKMFDSKGNAMYPLSNTPRKNVKYVESLKSLEQIFAPTCMENVLLLDLLRKIFVYDPAKRITAREALWHSYFSYEIASPL